LPWRTATGEEESACRSVAKIWIEIVHGGGPLAFRDYRHFLHVVHRVDSRRADEDARVLRLPPVLRPRRAERSEPRVNHADGLLEALPLAAEEVSRRGHGDAAQLDNVRKMPEWVKKNGFFTSNWPPFFSPRTAFERKMSPAHVPQTTRPSSSHQDLNRRKRDRSRLKNTFNVVDSPPN